MELHQTEGADKETGGLKLPSMSDSPVVTEQPPDPELLELMEEGDAETGEGDDGHKMKILLRSMRLREMQDLGNPARSTNLQNSSTTGYVCL